MGFYVIWMRRMIGWIVLALVIYVGFKGVGMVARMIYPLPYREILQAKAAENNLDYLLVAAVIRTESKFNEQALSSKGAVGLMQLQPETAIWAAQQMKIKIREEDLQDVDVNISIGCWYLRNLLDEFDNNLIVALAAYNGGRGNVRKWLEAGSWDGKLDTIDNIPFWETKGFVKKVLKSYNAYNRIYR